MMGFDLLALCVLALFGGFVIVVQWWFLLRQSIQIKELVRIVTLKEGGVQATGQYILSEQDHEARRNQPEKRKAPPLMPIS